MLRAISPIFFSNVEFVCSVDKYQPLSVARKRFLDRRGSRTYKIRV